eukprot:11446006-Heterocapsa_arctica.AAC.1
MNQQHADLQQHADDGNVDKNVVFKKVKAEGDLLVQRKCAVPSATLEWVRKTKAIVEKYKVYGSSRSVDQAGDNRRVDGLHDAQQQQRARMT